jgi:hypothetical protein
MLGFLVHETDAVLSGEFARAEERAGNLGIIVVEKLEDDYKVLTK